MRTLLIFVVAFSLPALASFSLAIEPGTPVDQLIEEKGQPASTMSVGNKTILKWPDLKVTAANGIVQRVEAIDPEAVHRENMQRTELAKQKQKELRERRERFEAEQARKQRTQPTRTATPRLEFRDLQKMQEAARGGNARTQLDLAMRYLTGNGVPKNDREAYRYFEMAAKGGYATAQYNLGVMHLEGRGVPRNPQLAREWFAKAADQRHREACYQLGIFYEEGRYVGRDIEQAYICYSLAAYGGRPEAAQRRERLAKMLTEDQLQNANRRVHKMRFWRY
jgi:hypothetical protein